MGRAAEIWLQTWPLIRRPLFMAAGALFVVWAWFAYTPPKPQVQEQPRPVETQVYEISA